MVMHVFDPAEGDPFGWPGDDGGPLQGPRPVLTSCRSAMSDDELDEARAYASAVVWDLRQRLAAAEDEEQQLLDEYRYRQTKLTDEALRFAEGRP